MQKNLFGEEVPETGIRRCAGCKAPLGVGRLDEEVWCDPCQADVRRKLETWNAAALSFGQKEGSRG